MHGATRPKSPQDPILEREVRDVIAAAELVRRDLASKIKIYGMAEAENVVTTARSRYSASTVAITCTPGGDDAADIIVEGVTAHQTRAGR
jgi:hypothetical protein